MQTAEMPSEMKKASSISFELVFKQPSKDAVKSPIQSPPKPSSLEEINKKQLAAQDRREQSEKERKEKLAMIDIEIAKKQAIKEEEDKKFKKQAEEKMAAKLKKALEIQEAKKEAMKERQKDLNVKIERAHAKKKEIGESEEASPDMTRAQ